MATIITRILGATAKGSPLSNAEIDANFINLNDELAEKMTKSANLSDVADVATARTNLAVSSTSQVNAKAIAMAIALG